MSDVLTLYFGVDKYPIVVHRFIAEDYPLVADILDNKPERKEISLFKDEKLTEVREKGLDLLFSLKYDTPGNKVDLFPALLDPSVIISALKWGQYLGLNDRAREIHLLLEYLVPLQGEFSEEDRKEVDGLLQQRFITDDDRRRELGARPRPRRASPSPRRLPPAVSPRESPKERPVSPRSPGRGPAGYIPVPIPGERGPSQGPVRPRSPREPPAERISIRSLARPPSPPSPPSPRSPRGSPVEYVPIRAPSPPSPRRRPFPPVYRSRRGGPPRGQELPEEKDLNQQLVNAVIEEDDDRVRYLLEQKADPNSFDQQALKVAVDNNNSNIIVLLLESGARPDVRIAIDSKVLGILHIFLEFGADPDEGLEYLSLLPKDRFNSQAERLLEDPKYEKRYLVE